MHHTQDVQFQRECTLYSTKRLRAIKENNHVPEPCDPLQATSDSGGTVVVEEKCPECGVEPKPSDDPNHVPHAFRFVREDMSRVGQVQQIEDLQTRQLLSNVIDVDSDTNEGQSSEKSDVDITTNF